MRAFFDEYDIWTRGSMHCCKMNNEIKRTFMAGHSFDIEKKIY